MQRRTGGQFSRWILNSRSPLIRDVLRFKQRHAQMNEEDISGDPVFHYSDATFVGHWWPHFVLCAVCLGVIVLGLIFIENVVRSNESGYPEMPSGVDHIQAGAGPLVFFINRSFVGPILIVFAGVMLILGSYLTFPSRASVNRQGMIESMGGIDWGLRDHADFQRLERDIQEGRIPLDEDGAIRDPEQTAEDYRRTMD